MCETDADRTADLRDALERIRQWADAYPISVFPEVDSAYLERAHKVLRDHGMTLDRISASNMRHALRGVGDIARAAILANE